MGTRGYRLLADDATRIGDDALVTGPVKLAGKTRLRPVFAFVLGDELPPDAAPGAVERAVGAVFPAVEFAGPDGSRYVLGERAVELPPSGPVALWQEGSEVDAHLPEDFGDLTGGLVELAGRSHGLRPGEVAVIGSRRPGPGPVAKPGTVHLQGPGSATVITRTEGAAR
ncbi:hypothetical protein [Amycolatopsis sp. 195334CR]|uniref:hypothetical protein n=1 Tax=Amycolatopsis sp. 195334CR TaxID=2814588 RepID=UPI001A8F56A0|nr:hypothetical protein [Amycolatopsis sp. 195334CR]MBN6038817.1 hypothetical protein [Amycolatopsis sp. 195334CR]